MNLHDLEENFLQLFTIYINKNEYSTIDLLYSKCKKFGIEE